MRSFHSLLTTLFALLIATLALAQDNEQYDATVYITSTVYRVNTVTMSGSPTASLANMTSTISAHPTPAYPSNGTVTSAPSGTGVSPTSPGQFTGAAAGRMGVQGGVMLVAGVAWALL